MSVESDARDCLIEAVGEHYNVKLTPEQLNEYAPADLEVGSEDRFDWHDTLSTAAEHMRSLAYQVREPELERAGELLIEKLVSSQLYMEDLTDQGGDRFARGLLAVGAVAGVAVLAVSLARSRRKR